MRTSILRPVIAIFAVAVSCANGLNVLITNDDGFETSHIRELKKSMEARGHNVIVVAPAINHSSMGGTVIFSQDQNLTMQSEFGTVKAGAPSVGVAPDDDRIWYYNGSPGACVLVALDYVLPRANFPTPDLVLSGPNNGNNLGPFLYTLSGTLGAAYIAVGRDIPSIAISAGHDYALGYQTVRENTRAMLPDPATVTGDLVADLVDQLVQNANGSRLLPLGYGLNVNLPYITSFYDNGCISPPFIQTRMTGHAIADHAAYNETTGLFTWEEFVSAGQNTCINGDCDLADETTVLAAAHCKSSVSIFTVDYDAPSTCHSVPDVRKLLEPLVQYFESPVKLKARWDQREQSDHDFKQAMIGITIVSDSLAKVMQSIPNALTGLLANLMPH